ncbi:5-oxoprolinase subunit PxpB [Paenibacillus roseipurpureus]|uniref:5-oxoprolinase subunit PxpB n=1 Tax=Paenibacillus roseopurpureus TaxID=2918901 RepID=A0AA96LPL3_9BACL|nr:5-oxoprolinase subunit PxpB [Paenibacillus sp. MBLB1832]WNR43629.1 5-oxoprolinase subunit PxpB [Paenibacillus sp. MBLB1832]
MTCLPYECYPLGDAAIVIKIGSSIGLDTLHRIRQVANHIESHWQDGFIELVPAYTTITLYYDPFRIFALSRLQGSERVGLALGDSSEDSLPYTYVMRCIEQLLDRFEVDEHVQGELGAIVEIPVCYEGDYGWDLAEVAAYHGVSQAQIVSWHTSRVYPVYMIGFAPGFPYLGGMDDRLATPRRAVPRSQIPAGSVAIGGAQTGIYPFETPGGWHLIGRTPLDLFRPESNPPSLLSVGDQVQFVPISSEQFMAYKEGEGVK